MNRVIRNLAFTIFALYSFSSIAAMSVITDEQRIYDYDQNISAQLLAAKNQAQQHPKLFSHLEEIVDYINRSELDIVYVEGANFRGAQTSDEACGCYQIYLNVDYFDAGPISTLVHEFEHAKHEIILGDQFFKDHPELDELTNIFGGYYYGNEESLKQHPKFKEAMFVGSAFMFYTEYHAFKMQLEARMNGIKDTIRPEKDIVEVMETIANEYFINHGINIDVDYVLDLANKADTMSPSEFFLSVHQDSGMKNKFYQLQGY